MEQKQRSTGHPLIPFISRIALLCVISMWLAVPMFAEAAIHDIDKFQEQCPTADPVYLKIRADFKLLRNGVPVGDISCTSPVSSMPAAQLTDELAVLNALRVAYYMDHGRSGHLPWTTLDFYGWMKTKVRGFNIDNTATVNSCCGVFGGEYFVTLKPYGANLPLYLKGLSVFSTLALLGHEVRHRDNFPHNSLCGITNGCDLDYDEANLSPYGISYFLYKQWAAGEIDIGIACLGGITRQSYAGSLATAGNNHIERFSGKKPGVLSTTFDPGSKCPAQSTDNCVFDWAEIAYEPYLGKFGVKTEFASPYSYRYYTEKNSYLGTSSVNAHLYYLGPASNQGLLDLGLLSEWGKTSTCK